VALKKLKEAEYNPRVIDPKKLDLLKKSLTDDIDFLDVRPVIVNMHPGREYIVVGGNMRVKAAKELGYKDIPCVFVNIDPIREKAWNIKDNQSYGSWETDLLRESLVQLKEDNYDLDLTGFNQEELTLIMEDYKQATPLEESTFDKSIHSRTPDIATNIEVGDVINVGKHKIVCGDSTNKEHVKLLTQGYSIQLLVTSPPYGVGLEYESEDENIDDSVEKIKLLLKNFIKAYAETTNTFVINFANIKCPKNYWQVDMAGFLNNEMEQSGIHLLDTRIWRKQKNYGTAPFWIRSHKSIDEWEYINIYQKTKEYKNHLDEKDNDAFGFCSVWEMPSASGEGYHPAKFPIILPYQVMKMLTDKGSVIIDPFGGSMTTLIAAEQLNRVSLCMELDPKYIQHALYRIKKLYPDIEITSDKDLLLDSQE
jgi:DNA modification methylase